MNIVICAFAIASTLPLWNVALLYALPYACLPSINPDRQSDRHADDDLTPGWLLPTTFLINNAYNTDRGRDIVIPYSIIASSLPSPPLRSIIIQCASSSGPALP
ncbi:hypothetical protein BP00DRAFT_61026 [Aspergillus indologenus CBS 114.80]|uniref:Uncharacterized protein n=1 Tax=Aspergillus indologenus CBS 114.80 TaxID=1450541 RepID=A0A2V5HRU7_9EURO|nr:hypothetical protein BP00DRAFT_61026 [Aspergillus indologenus CBS 114.80]